MAAGEEVSGASAGSLSSPLPVLWTAILLLGISLMIVGVVVTSSTTFLIDFGPGGRTCDANLVRNVSTIGSIVGRTGAMLLVLGLFAAGAASRDLHYNVRAFLFLGGAISLIFASLIFPSFGGFSPFSC